MVLTQISREKLGGHYACLGNIARNISKMGIFAHFLRGAWGEFYKIWLKLNKFQSFHSISFTNCQFNCIVFVKEH